MTALDLQPSLFTQGGSAEVTALDRLAHTDLGRGAWIEHLEGWLTDDLEVFDALRHRAPWRQGSRVMYDRTVDVPRLTAWCTDPARLPHPTLVRAFEALNDRYGPERFTTAGLCWYRDGHDSVAWHGDTIGRSSSQDTMVAIVSLGATRVFAMRPRGGGPSLRLPQGHGDLLVMGGSCQRTWEHAVPKTTAPKGPRISIQFRPRNVH